MNSLIARLVFWCAMLAGAAAQAADPPAADPPAAGPPAAGRVKHVVGAVTLVRGDVSLPLEVGAVVLPGDRIVTGPRSRAGLTLADDTLLAVGSDTDLSIDEFSFNATRQEGGLLATVFKGAIRVVSGLLARRAPESVRFRTPTMVLGVRGTEFIIDTRGSGQ